MKYKLTLLFAALGAAVALLAAAAVTYTKQGVRVVQVDLHVAFDAVTGQASSAQVTAFIQNRRLVNDADATDIIGGPVRKIQYDLLSVNLADTTITAGGKTITHKELFQLTRRAALDQAAAARVD